MTSTGAHIGLSGWYYKHWTGTFYPEGLKPGEYLPYLASQFDTVEVNNSFYRLPARNVFEGWQKKVPGGFIFSVKASRYITHFKRLLDPVGSTERLFKAMSALGDKAGPVLFQVPPTFRCDLLRLRNFLKVLPDAFRYVFEFRHESWFNDQVYEVLSDARAAFCISEIALLRSPIVTTTDFVYVRLHGPSEKPYAGSYSDAELRRWKQRLLGWQQEQKAVYCYFDNTESDYAVRNALRLKKLAACG